MKLWRHVWAHKRSPLYAFCEWYVFGRESTWEDAPAGVDTQVTTRTCSCMQISGPLVSASCDQHGRMQVEYR
jgi:hypothetical protein